MRLVSGQQHYKRYKRGIRYKRMQQVERKDGPENVKRND